MILIRQGFSLFFLQYFLYIRYYSDIFPPGPPKWTLLLHPAAALAGLETAALFGSYCFSILKVGILCYQRVMPLLRKSIEISLPWHSSTIPIADMTMILSGAKLNKSLKPQNPAKPLSPKDFFGCSGYYTQNTRGYLAKPESLVVPSRPPPAERTAEDQPFFTYPGTLKILVLESIFHQGQLLLQPPS